MFYTIYRIINITNNKQYIGKHQTNDIDDGYMGSGKLLRKAISKHGLQNFIKEILYVFETEEEMNAKEAELVTEAFCIREDTYNICVGGQGGFGYINNNETLRIEKNKKARKTTNDRYSEKLSDWGRMGAKAAFEKYGCVFKRFPEKTCCWKGRKHSDTTKEKIGLANKNQTGLKNSQFGTKWITNGVDNKKIKADDDVPRNWRLGRVLTLKER